MRLRGMGDFFDDYGNLVVEDESGSLTVIPQEDTSYVVTAAGAVTSVPTTAAVSGQVTPAQRAAIAAANPGAPGATDWLSQLAAAVPKALQLYNAQQIASVNIRRAEQGLSPLNAGLYGPQVGVGMDAATQRTMMWGAAGIGALLLLGGGRRR